MIAEKNRKPEEGTMECMIQHEGLLGKPINEFEKASSGKLSFKLSFKLAVIYTLLGFLWIILSDRILLLFVNEANDFSIFSILKGLIYVIITSAFLFFLVKKEIDKGQKWAISLNESYKKLEAVNSEVYQLAYFDFLTGLPNRILFEDRLKKTLSQCRRSNKKAAVLYIDVDNFKDVNDSLGHAAGDKMLKSLGEMLGQVLRETDTVARLGGDEFGVLVTDFSNPVDLTCILERIKEVLSTSTNINGREFFITTSTGIAIFPEDGADAQTIFKNADMAMYSAKEHGKNCSFFYTPGMNERIMERLEIENSLRYAIKHNELMLYYQPQICMKSGEITGVEALVRWVKPDKQVILPSRFIQIAEEAGMIIDIGEWVLNTACRQNKTWQDLGYAPIRISVNLSARQFQQRNLVDVITGALKNSGLDAQWLELEITETMAVKDLELTLGVLKNLKQAGIHVSLDDFGTGYSSLNYLRRLPIDTLKIDKTFIHEISKNPVEEEIAKAVISLAHSMKLAVTAEGVETAEQHQFLRSQSCDKAQGFLYSKPIPSSDIEALIKKGRISL